MPPAAPVNFQLVSNNTTANNYSVVFVWEHETPSLLSNYSIAISPTPLLPTVIVAPTRRRVTLAYSTEYRVEIIAVNCGGNSEPYVNHISYGKY